MLQQELHEQWKAKNGQELNEARMQHILEPSSLNGVGLMIYATQDDVSRQMTHQTMLILLL